MASLRVFRNAVPVYQSVCAVSNKKSRLPWVKHGAHDSVPAVMHGAWSKTGTFTCLTRGASRGILGTSQGRFIIQRS